MFGSAFPLPADVTLVGTVGPRTINDNVLIARNTTCVLDGTLINGNVRLGKGARLVALRARVVGNVSAPQAAQLDLRLATRVEGDVRGEGTRSIILQTGTVVTGDVQLDDSPAPSGVDALLVVDSTVAGKVLARGNSGRLRIAGCRISGNVALLDNRPGSYLIRANQIGGSIRFLRNRGSGVISVNQVEGNLVSRRNSPDPRIGNNTVDGDIDVQ
jgi:hypothetical protein